MNKINYLYSATSITLHDALLEDNTILNDFVLSTVDRTNKFKNMFIACYDTKSLCSEVIETFKLYIKNKFNEYKDYYEDLLDIYERQLDYDKGIVIQRTHNDNGGSGGSSSSGSETSNIELPNRTTSGEYVSDKVKGKSNQSYSENYEKHIGEKVEGNVNVIDQREKALKFVRSIYRNFVNEFSDCFACVYN